MSGPYSISGVMKDFVVLADETYLAIGLMPYLVLAYQELDPSLPGALDDIFRAPYLPAISSFRDGFQSGASSYRAMTRSLLQTYFATTGSAEVYPYRLLTPAFEQRLREGDGEDPWLVALRQNDPYDFANPTPTRLLYCRADEQADYRNALLARDSLLERGAVDVQAVDVGPNLDHGACFAPAIAATVGFFGGYRWLISPAPAAAAASAWEVTRGESGLAFRFPAEGLHRVEVFDGLGRRVAAETFRGRGVVPAASASTEIAFVRVTGPDGYASARVVLS